MVFPHKANGSLIEHDGKIVGSELIGQQFDAPRVLLGPPLRHIAGLQRRVLDGQQPRPNQPGPARRSARPHHCHPKSTPRPIRFRADRPGNRIRAVASTPTSLLPPRTTRQSRVANARKISLQAVQKAIAENTESRTFGLLGEPRVNVLKLNLALDASQK